MPDCELDFWADKFGKKKLRWYRKNLRFDLLANKFPKKKNRRLKRIKRNELKRLSHQYAYLIKKTIVGKQEDE